MGLAIGIGIGSAFIGGETTPPTPPPLVTSGLVLNLAGSNSSSLAEGSSTWYDLTSNNYDGAILNGATYTTDKGGGLTFDGIDDTLDLGTILDGVIAGTSPTYTIQTWIKFDTLADDTLYCFFTKQGAGNNRQLMITLRNLTSYGLPAVRLIRNDGPTTIAAGNIYNLTITFDGSINTNDGLDRLTFYIDGVLQDKAFVLGYRPLTNTFQATTMKVALNGFIGTGTVPTSPYAGTNYQTLVYDRVLTQEEVTQNFNSLNGRYGT